MPRLRLTDFATPDPDDVSTGSGADDMQRLAAYEDGYKAGWDDAATAHAGAQAELANSVAQHLQTLTFGYQDARRHVLLALQPLLSQVTEVLLPAVARVTLPSVVVEALMPLAQARADKPVQLRISAEARIDLEKHLSNLNGMPVTIIEDDRLSGGQVVIDPGGAETQVDLDAVVAAVTHAVRDFLETEFAERNDE